MNADRVINFIKSSTPEEIAFLIQTQCQHILIWDGKTLTNAETCTMNGLCFQINLDNIED